jgi:hypothetical protein
MLGPNRFSPPLAAGMRMGLLGLLVLLAGLFWAWTQAHAAPAPLLDVSDDEVVYWAMADVEGEDIEPGESALSPTRDLICRKPAPYKPGDDQVLTEIADQDLPSCPRLWITLARGVPTQDPQLDLPQAERQPLLRPPAGQG